MNAVLRTKLYKLNHIYLWGFFLIKQFCSMFENKALSKWHNKHCLIVITTTTIHYVWGGGSQKC